MKRLLCITALALASASSAHAEPRLGPSEPLPSGPEEAGIAVSIDGVAGWLPLPGPVPRARLDLPGLQGTGRSVLVENGAIVGVADPARSVEARSQCADGSVLSAETDPLATTKGYLVWHGADGSRREAEVERPFGVNLTRITCTASSVVYSNINKSSLFDLQLAPLGALENADGRDSFFGADAAGKVDAIADPSSLGVVYKGTRTVISNTPRVDAGPPARIPFRAAAAGGGLVVSYYEAATPNQASNVLVTVNANDQVVVRSMATDDNRLFDVWPFSFTPLVSAGAVVFAQYDGVYRYPLAPLGQAPDPMVKVAVSGGYEAFGIRGETLEGWRADGNVDRYQLDTLAFIDRVPARGHAARRNGRMLESNGRRYVLGVTRSGTQLWDGTGTSLIVDSSPTERGTWPFSLTAAPDGLLASVARASSGDSINGFTQLVPYAGGEPSTIAGFEDATTAVKSADGMLYAVRETSDPTTYARVVELSVQRPGQEILRTPFTYESIPPREARDPRGSVSALAATPNGAIAVMVDSLDSGLADSMAVRFPHLYWASLSPTEVRGPFPLSTAFLKQVFPRIACDPRGVAGCLAVWEDYRQSDIDGDVYAARILPDGSTPDGDGFPVSRTLDAQQQPDVAWTDDGEHFFVSWLENPGGDAPAGPSRARGAAVRTDGTVEDPAGVDLGGDDSIVTTPQLGAGQAGVFSLAYTRFDTDLASFGERITFRRVESGTLTGGSCNGNEECAGRVCIDGICCEASCRDGCGVCNDPTRPGICVPRPAGSAPLAGQCPGFVCHGDSTSCPTRCEADSDCADGVPCDPNTGICRTSSACRDGVFAVDATGASTSCAPFACAAGACLTSCRSIDDCAAPLVCAPDGQCVTPLAPAQGGCNGAGSADASAALLLSSVLLSLHRRRRRIARPRS